MRRRKITEIADTDTFAVQHNEAVVQPALDEVREDPALLDVLDTLDESMDRATVFPAEMLEAMRSLTAGVEIDLDEPLEDDVAI
tara:strand:+ start:1084 stop:1335 length:252 start_codon:yes stop_codon:yes gene_type:complete